MKRVEKQERKEKVKKNFYAKEREVTKAIDANESVRGWSVSSKVMPIFLQE
jgi:hypothetical protein